MKNNLPIDIDALMENVFKIVNSSVKQGTNLFNSETKENSTFTTKESKDVFSEMTELFNEEIVALFKDWFSQVISEINEFVENNKNADAEKIAGQFQISKESAEIFLKAIKKEQE